MTTTTRSSRALSMTGMQLFYVIKDYSHRSSLHGISHFGNSKEKPRKYIWLILFLFGFGISLYHVYLPIENFRQSPIASSWFSESQEMIFPDVTFCNRMPVGNSIIRNYNNAILEHFRTHWNYFASYDHLVKRIPNETISEYKYKRMGIFHELLQIFWVSDDTRGLGMTDELFPFLCYHSDKLCDTKSFRLIQDHSRYNCYTYQPETSKVTGKKDFDGLWVILYTDSVALDHPTDIEPLYFKDNTVSRLFKSGEVTFKNYIENGGSINSILNGQRLLDFAYGMSIHIHPRNRFPLLQSLSFDVSNHVRSVIEVDQTNHEFISYGENICNEDKPESISYVTSFGSNGTNVRRHTYEKTHEEYMVELSQDYVYHKCQCYSHLWPFTNDPSELCFFVPESERRNPSDIVLKKIDCHYNAVLGVKEKTFQFAQIARKHKPCYSLRYSATKNQVRWPNEEAVRQLVNPSLLDISWSERMRTNYHILGDLQSESYPTKAEAMRHSLMSNVCKPTKVSSQFENSSETASSNNVFFDANMWCSDTATFGNNFLLALIKPEKIAASLYKEDQAYKWPEVLSEIGGTMGLWLGMSLLTFFEVLELFFLCCFQKVSIRKNELEENNMDLNNVPTIVITSPNDEN